MSSAPAQRPPRRAPRSVRVSILLVLALVLLSLVNAVLTYVHLDQLAAAAVAAQDGGPRVDEDTVRDSLVTVTLADLAGLGVLRLVLARALAKGARWARTVLTGLALLGLVFGAMGLRVGTERPTPFVVTGAVALALNAALVYFLWRQDSTDFLRPADVDARG